MVHMTDDAS